jgi:hypothetical protein
MKFRIKPKPQVYRKWKFLLLPRKRYIPGGIEEIIWLEWVMIEYTYTHDLYGGHWVPQIVGVKNEPFNDRP